mmetsp:Transcript_53353/g.115836  ORF Transcript_53353/g.115836 Transcript_53353/m.115836 type:complete len:144 (+) Transcript_53353:120-551(+)
MTTIQVRATRGEHTLEDAEKLLDTEKIKSAILESVSKATENGEQKVDVVIEVRLDPPRSRTDYRCGRCGQMKRGHVCPVSLSRAKRRSKKRQDDEEEPEAPSHFVLAPAGCVSASLQVFSHVQQWSWHARCARSPLLPPIPSL